MEATTISNWNKEIPKHSFENVVWSYVEGFKPVFLVFKESGRTSEDFKILLCGYLSRLYRTNANTAVEAYKEAEAFVVTNIEQIIPIWEKEINS